ncbi:alpha/beta-hydrolase [Auricularia subglabra TFB-10046 SS5]|uniref:Alpha/beta-hydrolase n=1 Tax=Auricularia subglabra (strain TFB-10046 / SS5) TaxID=717982 RepID=J0D9N0_AURST|nr:alpha/beta-hydrolase [Auricularia subglabra TFB-10046 SS5]
MPADNHRLTPGAHKFTTAHGATLTYFVKGRGPRLLVNVAPGWGCASILYQNSFGFLERDFTIAHLEVRGTRGSSFPHDLAKMSSWHMAEDVEALRHYLGVDALDSVTGHSNGGCIALWYAIRYPRRLRHLVLLDSQLLGPEADAVGGAAMDAILATRPERDAVDALKDYDPAKILSDEQFGEVLNKFLPLYFAQPDRDMPRFQREIFINLPEAKPLRTQAAVEGQHSKQDTQLDNITAKTLIIVGRGDFICPVEVSELIDRRVRSSTLHVVEDSGHFPWIEHQPRVWPIIKSFYGIH